MGKQKYFWDIKYEDKITKIEVVWSRAKLPNTAVRRFKKQYPKREIIDVYMR